MAGEMYRIHRVEGLWLEGCERSAVGRTCSGTAGGQGREARGSIARASPSTGGRLEIRVFRALRMVMGWLGGANRSLASCSKRDSQDSYVQGRRTEGFTVFICGGPPPEGLTRFIGGGAAARGILTLSRPSWSGGMTAP